MASDNNEPTLEEQAATLEDLKKQLAKAVQTYTHETLGRCVVYFSFLERSLEVLVVALLRHHRLAREAARLVVVNLDIREKSAIAIALACDAKLKSKLLEKLLAACNVVTGELRNERNRIFHDSWTVKSGVFQRKRTVGSRVKRPQARKIVLDIPQFEPASYEELQPFMDKCYTTAGALLDCAEIISEMPSPERSDE